MDVPFTSLLVLAAALAGDLESGVVVVVFSILVGIVSLWTGMSKNIIKDILNFLFIIVFYINS